jgi:hypothetical protein
MKNKITGLITALLFAVASANLLAQENKDTNNGKSQEVVVRIQQEQPKVETPTVQKANEWVDFGKNVGSAMKEGLSALTDEANKFSGTPAGRFTMAVIAWKVAGRDAVELVDRFVGVLIGVPSLIVVTFLYAWFMRKTFICHKVCVKKSGFLWWGTREYKVVNERRDAGGDTFGAAFITTIVYALVCLCLFCGLVV